MMWLEKCDKESLTLAHKYKDYQNKLLENEWKNTDNLSIWSPSCIAHCFREGKKISRNWEVPEDSGNNINSVVKEFLENEGKKRMNYLDRIDWPENTNCA